MPFFRRPDLALSGESRSRGAGPENSTGDAERAPAGASRQNRPIWESCSRLTRRRRFVGPPGKTTPRGAASARPGRYAAPPGAGRDFFPSPSFFLAHKDEPGRGSSRPLLRGRERVAPRPASRLPTPRRPGLGAVFGRTARGGSRAVPRRRRRGVRPAGCSRPPSRGLGLRKGKGDRGKGLAKKIRPKISPPQTVPHAAVAKRYAFFSPALFGPVGRVALPRRGARKLDRGCRARARRGKPAESADLGKLLPANPPRRFVGPPGKASPRGAASARPGRYAAPPGAGRDIFPSPSTRPGMPSARPQGQAGRIGRFGQVAPG